MSKKIRLFMLFIMIISILILVSQNVIFSSSTPTKIMPLGDSITAMGNWRFLLLSNLTDSGFNVEFVGTQQGNTPNEGHGGMQVTDLASSGQLESWLSSTNPDIIIMHFGTNDIWASKSTSTILNSYTILVSQMRKNNAKMKIMVAKLLPMYPSGSGDLYNNRVIDLNSSIDNWAKELSTTQSPIIVVDQYSGFNSTTDTSDGVHENDNGDIKIANKWFEGLKNVLIPSGSTSSLPTSTINTTATPTSTNITNNSNLKAEYTVSNSWGSGGSVSVKITNNSSSTVSSWTVQWVFPSNQQITNIWGGTYTQNSQSVIVKNAEYNGIIAPNSSVTFGFNYSGSNGIPSSITAK
jgi:lysophospholipase L1-like esterase